MDRYEFWQRAVLAALESNSGAVTAVVIADTVTAEYEKRLRLENDAFYPDTKGPKAGKK